jgi:transketolase
MKNLDSSFNSNDAKQWSRMGPRAMFGQFMIDIAKKNKRLMVLSADLGRSSGLDRFKVQFPNQYLSVGIGEQNLIGVAAGLAKEGFKVFVTSFAPFLSMRASEHIRMNLGYMKHPVNLVALGSGVSMGFLGNSHFGLEDISFMRSIPNINVSSPADCGELKKILYDYNDNTRGPSYIRLTGVPGLPNVYNKDYKYLFGKPVTIINGNDVLIIATGAVLHNCILASKILKNKKINAKVMNIHTLKPLLNSITSELKKFKKIITVEEHSEIGGLGSIISEKISKNGLKATLKTISLPDNFGPTGNYKYLIDYHGLTGEKIAKQILKSL